jgi:hypothetical protein
MFQLTKGLQVMMKVFALCWAMQISKLQEQFEADSFQLPPKSDIFRGVCIFVNGYTQPSLQVWNWQAPLLAMFGPCSGPCHLHWHGMCL